jgi:hypothetical protein
MFENKLVWGALFVSRSKTFQKAAASINSIECTILTEMTVRGVLKPFAKRFKKD